MGGGPNSRGPIGEGEGVDTQEAEPKEKIAISKLDTDAGIGLDDMKDETKELTAKIAIASISNISAKIVKLEDEFKNYNPTQMAAHIRNKLGGGDIRRKIKGKTAYLWYLPWIRKNSDDFKTPDMDEDTPF